MMVARSLTVVEEDVQGQEHPCYASAEIVERLTKTVRVGPEYQDLASATKSPTETISPRR